MPDRDREDRYFTTYEFAKRIAVALGIGMLFLLAMALLWFAGNVLLLAFAGVLVAILLRDIMAQFSRFLKLPSGFALAVTLLLLVGIFVGVGWFLAPHIADQTDKLMTAIPQSFRDLQRYLGSYEWGRSILRNMPAPADLFSNSSTMLSHVGAIFSGTLGAVVDFLVISFIGIYLAAKPETYVDGVLKLLPQRARPRGHQVLLELGRTLRMWLRGKVFSMAVIGVLTTIGLFLIGVPLALTIGLLAGLLDFIPYIGPVIAATPAVLLTLSKDPMQAVYVVLLFVFLQSIEGYLLLPLVERRSVSLPSGVIILVQVLFGLAFGLLGMAMATPVAASAMIAVAMLYVQDVLGDRVKIPGER